MDIMKPTLVAIYARYSTERQDARSIEDQMRRCEAYAAKKAWTVVQRFSDEAESGTTIHREQLQNLLATATRKGNSPFSIVLVDDLSRLSRDVGDALTIMFGELADANVTVEDCGTGMNTAHDGAKLQVIVNGIYNTIFIDNVRKQTHRGLEGRALKGFSTGGRAYGYKTEPEPNPTDPLHPRKCIVVHEQQGDTVRRIFNLYADGTAMEKIAATLNSEGLPS